MVSKRSKFSLFELCVLRKDVRNSMLYYFDKYLSKDMSVYDVGCGEKPFAEALSGKVKEHIGVDIEDGFYNSSHIDLVGSAYDVPVDDGSADAVISSQVIEHLDRPIDAIAETSRILKTDGFFIISFPFLYPIHAEPHDFTRFTEYAMQQHLEAHGFEVVEFSRIGGFWYIAGMYLHMYLKTFDHGIFKTLRITKAISWFLLWIITLIHRLEGFGIKCSGKEAEIARKKWTVNYVFVARRIKVSTRKK